jgi:carboxymethylenebutenolidase
VILAKTPPHHDSESAQKESRDSVSSSTRPLASFPVDTHSTIRKPTMIRTLAALTALALLSAPVTAADKASAKTPGSFQSAGRAIGLMRFDPTGVGPHPAVVLLHGLEGADTNAGNYEAVAKGLAGRGYVVFVVRYFDCFAGRVDELAFFRANVQAHLTGHAHADRVRVRAAFGCCLATVADAVRHARTQPGIDADRVGIVGFSLGGFLAMSAATQPELKVTAVVELFGGLPDDLHARARAVPVLILHGDRDAVVPVAQAQRLEKTLKDKGATPEVQVYPGVGHVFVNDKGEFQLLAALDAEARSAGFLHRHLKRPAE